MQNSDANLNVLLMSRLIWCSFLDIIGSDVDEMLGPLLIFRANSSQFGEFRRQLLTMARDSALLAFRERGFYLICASIELNLDQMECKWMTAIVLATFSGVQHKRLSLCREVNCKFRCIWSMLTTFCLFLIRMFFLTMLTRHIFLSSAAQVDRGGSGSRTGTIFYFMLMLLACRRCSMRDHC